MSEDSSATAGHTRRAFTAAVPWILSIALGSWATWLTVQRYAPQWLESKAERSLKEVQHDVASVLKDPESARFSNVWLGPDGKYACGEVNARNSMGGYTGRTSFMLQRSSGRVELDPDEATNGTAAERLEQIEKKLKFLDDVRRLCGEPPGKAN